MGGTVNSGSGNGWVRKADITTREYLVEHKYTGKNQFTMKAEVLETVVGQALLSGRVPVLAFHLNGKNYVALTEDDFLEMKANLESTT